MFDLPLTNDPIGTVTGQTELEQLGFYIITLEGNDENLLLVSAPTAGKCMDFSQMYKRLVAYSTVITVK